MARVDVDQDQVFAAIIALLRTDLGLEESQCYETLYPESPAVPPGGEFFVTVAPGPSVFDEEMQVGGGAEQCSEDMQVIVTIYTRTHLDQTDHDHQLMHHETVGFSALKKRVLKSLVDADPQIPSGDEFLRQTIKVISADKPEHDRKQGIAWMGIYFRVAWDWDLS